MTKRDYIAIADIIRTARNRYGERYLGVDDTIKYITVELMDYMTRDNRKFNRDLFLNAIDITGVS